MAETVTVAHGDTLTGILKRKRGLNDGQLYTWLRKVRPLNPHIGYFQAFRRRPSRFYMAPIARQLNGRVGFFRALGRHATWYVPAVIGLYNVYDASPEIRIHTLFAEGFGIVGGAIFTKAGAALGGWIALSILGLGPFGLFISRIS
jgi:hypothetical protein